MNDRRIIGIVGILLLVAIVIGGVGAANAQGVGHIEDAYHNGR